MEYSGRTWHTTFRIHHTSLPSRLWIFTAQELLHHPDENLYKQTAPYWDFTKSLRPIFKVGFNDIILRNLDITN